MSLEYQRAHMGNLNQVSLVGFDLLYNKMHRYFSIAVASRRIQKVYKPSLLLFQVQVPLNPKKWVPPSLSRPP